MIVRRLVRLALTLAIGALAHTAPGVARAQERLLLQTFGDEALHRLGLKVHDEAPRYELELSGGVEGALARGAAPSPTRPLGITWGLGFGARRNITDLLQIRTQNSLALPFGPGGTGSMSAWDLEGAHRIRAQLGLGGIDGDHLEKGRGGADLELEGSLWQESRYGTAFVRRDIGPYAFVDGGGRATVAPRLAADREVGIVLPISAEARAVEVNRPEGIFGVSRARLSSGFGVKPYTDKTSHGWFELVGAGWEQVAFSRPAGAPRAKLGAVERFDLRFLHLDGLVFSPEKDIEIDVGLELAGNWLHDPTSRERLSAFTAAASAAVRGYPDHQQDKERVELAFGVGALRDAIFMADASGLTKRVRVEGFFESAFLDRRVGGAIRGAAEQLPDLGPDHPFRGAVAAEWFLSPIRHLQLGMHYTSTQQCVSTETAAGPAWCHRFGVFVRGDGRGTWAR